MSDIKALFDTLRAAADPQVVSAIEALVSDGSDRELCRINVPDFAAKRGLDEEKAVGAFLHAARLGLFELTWNVLCPGCGGVLDAMHTLKSVRKEAYECALCACGYEPTLDEMVEVAFTISPARAPDRRACPAVAADRGILPAVVLGVGRRSAGNRLGGIDR